MPLLPPPEDVELLTPREVPLGGPRAMLVRRTLPHRHRRAIGAWCFVDAYGPDDVAATGGMVVPPHPHTGLQTVSWLFSGEVLHRDSLGAEQVIRPGQLNLMTAGRGIAHSEDSTPNFPGPLHGIQFWVALPATEQHRPPDFAHHADLPTVEIGAATATVILGSLTGATSPARHYTPLLGAEVALPVGTTNIPVRPDFEHGLLPIDADVTIQAGGATEVAVGAGALLAVDAGRESLRIAATTPTRLFLIGGEPFEEEFVMWWNFLAADYEGIVTARTEWEAQADRFGTVAGGRAVLAAPTLPTTRLRPRGHRR